MSYPNTMPLDLSRRCFSVETMKTPSPYSSGSSSPPFQNSPPSMNNHHMRPSAFDHSSHSSQYSQDPFASLHRDTPSPPDLAFYGKEHMEHFTPYVIQAAALQYQLSQTTPKNESNESAETSSVNKPQALSPYPFQMGRDGKLSRPFKAYPRDPLSVASFSIANAQSAERFEIYRLQMLKQIHAANGGQATVSNPKMRRTSSRTADCESNSNVDNEAEAF